MTEILTVPKRDATSTRYFVGFDQRDVTKLERWLVGRVTSAAPEVRLYRGARLFPLKREALGVFRGGVYLENEAVHELALTRGDQHSHILPVAADELSAVRPSVVDGAWFGGYLFDHYGHFLLEGLSRVLDRRVAKSDLPIFFFNPMKLSKLRPYMADIFDTVGIDPGRVQLCDTPVLIKRLRAIDPTFVIRSRVNSHALSALADSRIRRATSDPAKSLLYLSRTRLNRRRHVEGEEAVEAFFSEHGAEIVYPESLTVPEQLERIAAARWVIACEGSALHNMIFAPPARHVVVLSPAIPHLNFLLCDELIAGDTYYIAAAGEARESKLDRNSWAIDPEKVRAGARTLGLTTSPI